MLIRTALVLALALPACFANPTPHPGSGADVSNTGGDAAADGLGGPADAVASDTTTTPDLLPQPETFADTGADAPMGPDAFADATADAFADAVADAAPDTAPDATSDAVTDSAVDAVDDSAADATPDGTPDATPDAVPDTTADAFPDAKPDSTGACGSTFEIPVLLHCGADFITFYYWSDWADDTCPTWFTPTGQDPVAYDTLEALAAAENCSADCLYNATMTADFLTCDGPKSGYDVYEAAAGCPGPVYNTPDGVFEDLCDWDKYACYCTDP